METSSKFSDDEILQWSDQYLLGYAPMDDVHEEFVNLMTQLQCAKDPELLQVLEQIERHTRAHFEMENRWMRQTDFPARDCHMDEHAAVLESIGEVRVLTANGNFEVCRRLANSLADWFPNHADYLDSALAHWMCKQSLGGKPVVLRRDLNFR